MNRRFISSSPGLFSLLLIFSLLLAACGNNGPPTSGGNPASNTPAPPAATATPAPPAPPAFTEQERITAAADGAIQSVAGAEVALPADAVESENPASLELAVVEGSGAIVEQLDQVVQRETPFYTLQMNGESDSRLPVQLRLPATSPDSRVAVLVDGIYLFVYEVEPQDGFLSIPVRVPAATPPDLAGDPMATAGTSHYFVIGPRSASAPLWDQISGVSVAHAQNSGNRNCIVYGDIPVELSTCRRNASGSVQVAWGSAGLITTETADAVIAATEEGMRRLADAGFTAAKISGLNPAHIAIIPGDSTPTYNSTLGRVRIGAVAAGNIAGEASRFELWHELMHWVEDENYTMLWGFVNGDLRWWLESVAEVGVFLADPAAANHAATMYGRSTMNDMKTLIFQVSPYQWASDEQYLHAQLLRANICPSGCPLTMETFVAAVNAGTYPLQASDKRAVLRTNLDQYARYILTGQLSGFSDTVAAFSGGGGIGDYVAILEDSAAPFKLSTANYPPQIDTKAGTIEAPMQVDSVYPLLVASGAAAESALGFIKPPGQPAKLTIEPGVEIYYSLNGGEVQHHAGTSQLVIAPIHETIGYSQVRLVAISRESAATLKAKIEPIDLQGDWVFSVKSATITSNNCESDSEDGEDSSASITEGDMLNMLTRYVAPLGSYATRDDRLPGELGFVLDPGASLKTEPDDPDMTYTSSISVQAKEVVADIELFIPPPASSGQTNGAGVALAITLPTGLALFFMRRRRRGAAILMSLLAVTMLTGCLGLNISGTIGSEMHFGKLTYVAQPDAPTAPLWRLSDGKGTLSMDLTIVVAATTLDSESADGVSTQTETRQCQIEMAITAEGELFPDGVVTPPED
ncbi:FHA domain-containing protein [Oscillochloris trichoides DG-6]|uniref:FHA domain-containing protein n=1 Tax=Oscillochloris trichoides DG-6 TaxID=765420 RepID=E1IBP5_9CHLR|nr:hypothetical protein [Oscillochloris trichoides]EFO81464.1 FHA domain-containing protein [Oscillochloris trichoides DG-6]